MSAELDLAIQQAIANPSAANLRQLLCGLEQTLAGLPEELQLSIAGTLLAQLVEIYVARANSLLEAWEDKYNPAQGEPILTAELLHDVLRQTMTLNLDGIVQETAPEQSIQPVDSCAGTVDKSNLLEFLAQLDQEHAKQNALAVAHNEDISIWISTIADWMSEHHQDVSLLDLQRSLQMPLIEIWLALLLGGYKIEQRGDFYQTESIWVKRAFNLSITKAET